MIISSEKAWKIIDKYLYLKLCWSQALNHLTIPIQIFDKAILISVFLKVFNITAYWMVGLFGVVGLLFAIFIGHMSLKRGIARRETSLVNKYNPEIQALLRKMEKKEE